MNEQTVLPRWRGFNLLQGFTHTSQANFREDDFRWISDWGFNFVRLPLSYPIWILNDDVYAINEAVIERIDKAVEFARRHKVHVCINLHRAPGYCVNAGRTEPFNLWKDQEALDAFCFHWSMFAKRYKGIPSEELSFDLVNEPAATAENGMTRKDHERVVRTAVASIRAIDPSRLIIADGLAWGNDPSPELADLGIAQSCRAYAPTQISHYKAQWIHGSEGWSVPTWPLDLPDGSHWDKAALESFYKPWIELAKMGVGVHCGEGGAHNRTPHAVALAWFQDVLEVLTSHNIGYSLWNLHGSFGILNSGRDDVEYGDWYGDKLDTKLLNLLRQY